MAIYLNKVHFLNSCFIFIIYIYFSLRLSLTFQVRINIKHFALYIWRNCRSTYISPVLSFKYLCFTCQLKIIQSCAWMNTLNGHSMVLTLRDKNLPSPSLAEHEANRWGCYASYGCSVGPLWPSCRLFRQQRADRGTSDRKGFEGDKWRNGKTRGRTTRERCELSDYRKTCTTEWPSSEMIYMLIYARDSYMHMHP